MTAPNLIEKFFGLDFHFTERSNLSLTIDFVRAILKNPRQMYFARKLAESVLRDVPDRVFNLEIQALFDFVRDRIRLTRDIKDVETIKTLERIYNEIEALGIFLGDCDDATILLAGLLMSVGYTVRIVITSTMQNVSDSFNHIFLQVLNPTDNKWYNLDPTIKTKPMGTVVRYKRISYFSV